ncbi:sulfatase-like hydrolase/transferase [Microbacterium hominis]|nr:sulfatase-like hydrolase/transferase [Microbacterium hominis]
MTTLDPSFRGSVGTTVADSVPWWPEPNTTPRRNLVVVILDDTGWSDLGCFGSEIATPHIDALAHNGVRYSNFHVTPLCSPTRASFLTGKNNHAVGMRFLADTDTGFPNSRGSVRAGTPVLPQVLREQGYGTYLVGKWHLAPLHEITPAGPHGNWPLALGFDRYYGFLDGCTDQYEPELYEDNHAVPTPHAGRVPPQRGSRRQVDLVPARPPLVPAERSVLPAGGLRGDPRAVPGAARVHREVPRRVREGVGPDATRAPRAADPHRRRPVGYASDRAQRGRQRVGGAHRRRARGVHPPAVRLRRVPRAHGCADRTTAERPGGVRSDR